MEYKINEPNLKYEYYFNDVGEVYYYSQDDHEKQFVLFNYESREVFSHEPGKPERYITCPLVFLFGQADWVDVANLMARTAFDIPSHLKGYTRPKNHNAADLSLKNLEFIQLDQEGQRPVVITDYNGSIPYNMYKEEEEDTSKEKVQWTDLPGAEGMLEHAIKVREGRKKMDLGERDRSVVAETLYILIEDRGLTVANAKDALLLKDSTEVLELYLEGRDRVHKISDETIAKVNQERVRKIMANYKNEVHQFGRYLARDRAIVQLEKLDLN